MVRDSKGNPHPNHQLSHSADRMASSSMGKPPAGMAPASKGSESVAHTTLHDHGDGSFHLEHEDGSSTEHPHIGHALMTMAAKHSEGKHMHIHQHPMEGLTSHHAGEDGKVEGGHDHANLEALKDHMGKFLDEEEHEGGDWGGGGGDEDSGDSYGL